MEHGAQNGTGFWCNEYLFGGGVSVRSVCFLGRYVDAHTRLPTDWL